MKKYIELIRLRHYVKNFLIFLALIFSGSLLDISKLILCILGFISFSLVTSIVYIINDIKDINNDRNHPIKNRRPLAAGIVSINTAIFFCIIFGVTSIIINIYIAKFSDYAWIYLPVYLILNILYSFGLKNIPFVDISILVSGYFIRLLYGSSIIGVPISSWMFLTVISMSFYLVLGKRRNELLIYVDKNRKVLKHYTKAFLDKSMNMFLTLTITFYSLWCMNVSNNTVKSSGIILTVPLVILICMKYSYNIENKSSGDPVDVFFKDYILMSLVFIYALILLSVYY